MGKRKKEDNAFLRKKTEEKQIVLPQWYLSMEEGQFFQWSWNYKENRLNKH